MFIGLQQYNKQVVQSSIRKTYSGMWAPLLRFEDVRTGIYKR